MRLMQWRGEVMIAGVNARMRRLLGFDIGHSRQCHATEMDRQNTLPAKDTAPIHHTAPLPSVPPLAPFVPPSCVAYESQASLVGLAYPGVLPRWVERWVCDEEGSA